MSGCLTATNLSGAGHRVDVNLSAKTIWDPRRVKMSCRRSSRKQFQIQPIADDVEDETTLEELRRIGDPYAQGYWIGRRTGID
jgi:hypothetical protein